MLDAHSFDTILSALKSEPPTEASDELGDVIQDGILSAALLKLHDFAQSNGHTDLAEWAIAELNGYAADATYPSYRTVSISYFDNAGQAIPSLSEPYGSWPLLNGVQILELHGKHGLTLKLQPEILDFLSQACDRTVFGGHVSPSQIEELLAAVRVEAINKLKAL
jgi:AbiTii